MTTQLDLTLAIEARDLGIARVTSKNATFIATMCGLARLLCRQKGKITADDLREEAEKRGLSPTHFNCWGAVCISREWKRDFRFVEYTKSRRVCGHGNLIRVWELR